MYRILTFYKFMPLKDLPGIVSRLKPRLQAHAVKGTILLSPEGVNGSLGFTPADTEALKTILTSPEFFGALNFKEHESITPPFKRLLLRLKKEIITFKVSELDPVAKPAPYVSPRELKEWYDSGKDMVVIDTRNHFEIKFGAFKNAQDYKIRHFTDFKKTVENLPAELKNKTIVTYCTGGIRCEKAAPFMRDLGFKDVYQLEGGILNYFKEVGGAHYEGECFVFDHRVAVNPNLEETPTSYCAHCQAPIYDPKVKEFFAVRERYCENCLDCVPKYLEKKWQEFHRIKARASQAVHE